MHGEISAAFGQRVFEFFDKQTLATDLVEGLVEYAVTLGRHTENADGTVRKER